VAVAALGVSARGLIVHKLMELASVQELERTSVGVIERLRPMILTRRALLRGLAAVAPMLLAIAMPAPLGQARAPEGFIVHASPRSVPPIAFKNLQGDPMSLADFRGRLVLLNIWATWCAPCRREMPTLDSLQAVLGGPDFEVVALSADRQGRRVVAPFYHELGLWQLGIYLDPSGEAPRALNALGIPTTLLIDREGREIGRLLGPAEWDSPAMVAFLRGYVERWRPRLPSTTSARNEPRAPSRTPPSAG
jgi:thiol-disulfide isomerase/thioredoxin